jgi:glutamyl-tRNA reductase
MPILALGVSYRRADVGLLERLAFADDDYPKAYRRLRDAEAVSEAVLLSTCNRVEVYANVASYHAGFQELKRFLAEAREVDPEDFGEPLYSHYEAQAAEHLFSVAAGIDSVVVGEPQILAQVRQAFRRAEAEGCTGTIVSALFRGAVRAGRRARSETSIASSPAAFVEAGVALAERALGPLDGRPAAVVGAGAMASLAAAHLRDRGMGPIRIVNRSVERAARLAWRVGAEPARLEALGDVLRGSDLVVSSTGASGTVIRRSAVEEVVPARAGRPLFLLDLAVPRDVDPEAAGIPEVVVADLDDLKAELQGQPGHGEADLAAVRAIVAEEVARFEGWRRAIRLAPLIQALKDRGERAVAAELQRLGPKLAGLTDRQREAVEAVARGVAAKLLHDPIVRLREASVRGDAATRAAAELFDLEIPQPE